MKRAAWNRAKSSQGDVGDHLMVQNALVYAEGYAGKPPEFELARNRRMKRLANQNWTAAACLKEPPQGQEAEARRILLRVVRGRELTPEHARDCCARAGQGGGECAGRLAACAAARGSPGPL